jgi:protein involved in polysaccharide export with SLBB domain
MSLPQAFVRGALAFACLVAAAAAHAQQTPPAPTAGPTIPRVVNQPTGGDVVIVPGGTVASQRSDLEPRTAGPSFSPGEKTEFQLFVERSLGRELPLYGHRLFADPPSTFAPLDQIAVPADYVIGPGDEIHVRAWGQIDIDYRAVVDRGGKIFIPRVGELNVAGLQYQNLQPFVRTAVARLFRNFELNVSMGQLRSIQIFVVGQARRPGAYTVSSLSTLVNALFASGGPTYKGSLRNIQLKRGSEIVASFDLYDLLLRGDMSKDARLLPGDVIFIPPVGPLAAAAGSVNVPAIYELRPRSRLGDLIGMAGGLATTASVQRASLERIVARENRHVEEIALDAESLRREVRDGDVLNVFTLSPRIANAVTLRGNVAETMRFAWREGMKVSDIIPERDALIVPDYWLKKNVAGRAESWLRGERAPDAPDAARLRSDLVRSGVEVNWDYAVIERLDTSRLEPNLVPFNLGKAVNDKDPQHDLPLMPGDVVTVFSRDDIRVPRSRRIHYVRLEGEFATPGVYQIREGETLRELVMRVGGLSEQAYLYGAVFTREATRIQQQQQLDAAIARMEAEAERAALARAQAVITREEAESLEARAAAQRRLLAQLREIRATGRIVLDIPPNRAAVKHLPELPLEDGDVLFVPPAPGTVNVFGAVFNQNAYLYRSRARANDYLNQAGGPTRDADKKSIYIVRADGSVISEQQSGWIAGNVRNQRLMPGDTIVVPEDFEKFSLTKELKDWTQIFYQFALGVAAIKVLRDL